MIPYDITFHPKWWNKHVGICFSQEFFDDPKYRIDCDIKMRKALYDRFGEFGIGEKDPKARPLLGTDYLAAGYLHSQLMGCDIVYQEDNSPQVVCMELDEDTIEGIKAPDLETSPIWQNTKKQIEYLMDTYGHVETYVNLMGIQNIALDMMGQELMVSYYTAPDEVDELLQEITKLSIQVGKEFRKLSKDNSRGVTAILKQVMPECYLTSNCSVEMISNDLYEEFLLKYDNRLAEEFGCFGIHHCGQTMEHVVEGYKKVKGLVFAEVGAGSDMKKVREALPDVFLNARYSPARLLEASKADVEKEVAQLIEDGKGLKNNISISCVGIDDKVTDEQICNFLNACRMAGK